MMYEQTENIDKEKNYEKELNCGIEEYNMKNSLEGLINIFALKKNISVLGDSSVEIILSEEQTEKKRLKEK